MTFTASPFVGGAARLASFRYNDEQDARQPVVVRSKIPIRSYPVVLQKLAIACKNMNMNVK